MLNRNNKKLVSILTAAMMLAGFAVPSVMAENEDYESIISPEEIAMLDEAEEIAANDFENETEGVLITVPMGTENPDPYTDIEPLSIGIGYNRRNADADTNAAIESSVGVDGSKALAFNYDGNIASAGAEFEFVVPEGTEGYKISFNVYPENEQDLLAISTVDGVEVKENLKLAQNEWNLIEIYVTSEGRVININDLETFVEDTDTTVPKFSGIKAKDRGSVYVDNVVITAISALPAPIPDVKIGSKFDFDSYSTGSLVFINNTSTPAYEDVKGFRFYVGSRGNGAEPNTKISIDSGVGMDGTQALSLQYANFADANRGPCIELIEPEESAYMVTFYAKGDGNQAIIIGDSTSENGGTKMSLTTDWSTVQILMSGGTRTILCNGAVVESSSTTELPVLWGIHAAGSGIFYIDNYSISELNTDAVVDAVAASLDIAGDTVSYDAGTDTYNVSGDFVVETGGGLVSVAWSSSDTSLVDINSKNGKVSVTPKEGASVVITATIRSGSYSVDVPFTLNVDSYYQKVVNMVKSELEATTVYPNGTSGSKVTTMVLDAENTNNVYYDLALSTVTLQDGITIAWSTSDADILSKDGEINVDNMDENEVTLTKVVTGTVNGKKIYSESVDYPINVQFDPDEVAPVAEELAKAYALSADDTLTEGNYENSKYYSAAMEMLYDRYVTRFDANYADNFADIPDEVSEDFDLPTEGAFGSEITWASSITNIKVNSKGEATVTRATTDKTAKLTATFSSGASINADAKTVSVTVEKKKSSGSSGGGGGSSSYGGGNSYIGSLGSITATPKPSTTAPVQDTTIKGEFTDLGDVSWAAVAINYLADKGIVSGRTSTTFAPNDNITRAEFAKIITGVFDLPTGGISAGFADVADDAWYAPYVNTCFAAGIITGYDAATFGPDDLVTRQDMAVMVMRAANLKGVAVEAINEKIDFADADQIGAYAVDAVTTLQQGGIINGMTADTFAPTANATRAQAAKILYSFCN